MRLSSSVLALLALCSFVPIGRAKAAEAPAVRPQDAWVVPMAIPAPSAAAADRPLQLLLLHAQSHYGSTRRSPTSTRH